MPRYFMRVVLFASTHEAEDSKKDEEYLEDHS
jgi:hypothetical protein